VFSLMSEITEEGSWLSRNEMLVLRLLEEGGKMSPWELSQRSPIGMRETEAIVAFLVRKGLITKTSSELTFLQIASHALQSERFAG
jgi:DNA-binding MarR family transcriptional regulator